MNSYTLKTTLMTALFVFSSHCIAVSYNETAKGFIEEIVYDSQKYSQTAGKEQFKAYSQSQSPRATIIACSDSRVQMSKINKKSENDIFSIRVIGNQVSTAAGSIEYGIQYLKTPVAMVLGHSDCGAIRAAKTDYDHLSENVKRELDTIQLKSNVSLEKSLIENVNQQVKYLLEKYQDKVESGELVVLGAIYDFSNDFGYGYGSLVFINLNGETDQEKMNKSAYFKDTLALAHIGHQIKNGN